MRSFFKLLKNDSTTALMQYGNLTVPAVAFTAHARIEVIDPAEAPPGITAELHTLIGVNDGPPGPALLHR